MLPASIFANSYHLLLQPGPEVIEAAGGLHRFMGRPSGPIITDSGVSKFSALRMAQFTQTLDL